MSIRKYQQHYGTGFIFSLLIHGFLIVLFTLSLSSTPTPKLNNLKDLGKGEIVQATVVNDKLVEAEIKRQEIEEKQQKEEMKKVALAKEQLKQEREKEQQKLANIKKEVAKAKQEEETRLAEIKLAKEKERKQLEALRKEKEKEQKRLDALDEKRQEELDRAKHLRDARELEEKKQEALNAKQSENDKKLSAEKAAESEKLAAKRKGLINSELARYQALFRDKVNAGWIRAPGLPEGLICLLEIRLLPDGTVTAVQIINSSGNLAFDQAALAAVQKASPLPVPEEAELMNKFRHFTFEFKPPEVG